MEYGYMGDGQPPPIPDQVRVEVAWRYIKALEIITGLEYCVAGLTQAQEIQIIKQKINSIA